MKRRIIPALLVAFGFTVLAGCSTPSTITLNDGRELQAVDKPEYDDDTGFYEFEQLDGKRVKVNKDQVRTIQPM